MIYNEVKNLFKGTDDKQEDFGWYEFTLEDLGLPTADKILEGVKKIESKIGLFPWVTKHQIIERYKGFGLTYNPNFIDEKQSRYSQVWGSKLTDQYYGLERGAGDHTQ